ncbi:hypothetical protein HN014_14090 [Aquimarina sp. TRL1]|uniref:WbqC family protein n=1 Tax=Aquimarina sp. (strain TRL1) TaxID=2736252 RepID=UPI0015977F3B|nr:WbqC family protein [Aquimarina sp. TRL1]QKX05990.1 hypothetical protein HN014_14090 [Aquimarina sp. TRL1]
MYFGTIAQYSAIAQAKEIIFENEDNFQKQTYRNRMHVYGANGKLLLSIPTKHNKDIGRKKYKDILIENDFAWQKNHWKSLESAYRTSPFFEFYEDDIAPLFHTKKDFLLDFNYECIDVITDCLQLDYAYTKSTSFLAEDTADTIDLRSLVNAKKETSFQQAPYTQVFNEKHGFIPNLCILDLLFTEGPNALHYLENQPIIP